jgi:hypothetical protein
MIELVKAGLIAASRGGGDAAGIAPAIKRIDDKQMKDKYRFIIIATSGQ